MYNIEGQPELSATAIFSVDCNKKKYLNQQFLNAFLIMISIFMSLAALIHLKPKVYNVSTISAFPSFFVTCIHLCTVSWFYGHFLILLSGDVEIDPGPRHKFEKSLSICHWNLHSMSVDNYIKLSSLKAFFTVHKFT